MASYTDDGKDRKDRKDDGYDTDKWIDFWKSSEGSNFVVQAPHECLLKYEEKLFKGKKGAKVFVPLCGKTYDMIWFQQRGYQVVGVDIAEVAVKHFFKLNNLDFSVTPEPSFGGKLYQSDCGKIKIYVGDFFKFGPHLEKDFDAVWDTGGQQAIGKIIKQEYVDVIKSVISPECQIFVEDTVPTSTSVLTASEQQALYGPDFKVEELGFTQTEYDLYKKYEVKGFNFFHVHQ